MRPAPTSAFFCALLLRAERLPFCLVLFVIFLRFSLRSASFRSGLQGCVLVMGKGGRPKGRDTTGYHIQGPPKDKTDPNWRPRRGGKKSKKQKELFERRLYEEWLASQGVPPAQQFDQGAESDSSGFPDFPGDLNQLEEEVEVVIEEDIPVTGGSSGSGSIHQAIGDISRAAATSSSSVPVPK